MTTTLTPTSRFAARQHRNFNLLWTGLIVSNTDTWMQNVAQGWLVLQLTNSPLWLGLFGLSFAEPMIVMPLIDGAVVGVMLILVTPLFLNRNIGTLKPPA